MPGVMHKFTPTQHDLLQLQLPTMILATNDKEFYRSGHVLAALLLREGKVLHPAALFGNDERAC